MTLEFILLGLLRRPTSGFDLKKVIDGDMRHFWSAELSQIYPTLQSLEKRGWLQSQMETSKRGAGKRVYIITKDGHQALREWLENGPIFSEERLTYLAQLSLLGELGDLNQTLAFVEQTGVNFKRKLEAIEQLECWWADRDPLYPNQLPLEEFHMQLTLSKGMSALRASIHWSDEVIARLRTRIAADMVTDCKAEMPK